MKKDFANVVFKVEKYNPFELNKLKEVQKYVYDEMDGCVEDVKRNSPAFLFTTACMDYMINHSTQFNEIDNAYNNGELSDDEFYSLKDKFMSDAMDANPWLLSDEQRETEFRIDNEDNIELIRDYFSEYEGEFLNRYNIPSLDPVTMNLIPEVQNEAMRIYEEGLKDIVYTEDYDAETDCTPMDCFKIACIGYFVANNKQLSEDNNSERFKPSKTGDFVDKLFNTEMAVRNTWCMDVFGEDDFMWDFYDDLNIND